MTLYLVYSSIALTAFWLYYVLVLRSTTFFKLKRWFFLLAIFFAFLLPLTHYFLEEEKVATILNTTVKTDLHQVSVIGSVSQIGHQLQSIDKQMPKSMNWMPVIYILVCSILTIRSVYAAIAVRKIAKGAKRIYDNNIKVLTSTNIKQPFSFFGKIYLPAYQHDRIAEEVLLHEREHVTARHHIDLAVMQALSIILWFNPVVYFFKNALRLNLEYLADKAVLDHGADVGRYQSLLLNHALENKFNNPLTTNFTLPLKDRIMMMKKKRSNSWRKFTLVGILPLVGILMAMNTKASLKKSIIDNVGPLNFIVQTTDKPSISPVKESDLTRLSAGFGEMISPFTNQKQLHTGVDLSAKTGSPVYATADGIIEKADNDESKGNYIKIKHSDRYQTQYFHMSRLAVTVNDTVKKGDIIGYVGNTGKSTAPHLHYEVYFNGKSVDPTDYFDAC